MTPEDADLCARLRDHERSELGICMEAAARIEELLAVANASYIRAERAEAEIAVLRECVRIADVVMTGKYPGYDKARAALAPKETK